jgi:hypothetical protein
VLVLMLGGHIRGKPHGHGKINVRQRIHQTHGLLDVAGQEIPPFAAEAVQQIRAIGSGAVIDVAPAQAHDRGAFAVVNVDAARGRSDGRPYQCGGDVDPVFVLDKGSGPAEEIDGLFMVNDGAQVFEDLYGGGMDLLHLLSGQIAERRRIEAFDGLVHRASPPWYGVRAPFSQSILFVKRISFNVEAWGMEHRAWGQGGAVIGLQGSESSGCDDG